MISVYLAESEGRKKREIYRRQIKLFGLSRLVETVARWSTLRNQIFKPCLPRK
jgi:hypothetical protein